jgi:hypothetical protein
MKPPRNSLYLAWISYRLTLAAARAGLGRAFVLKCGVPEEILDVSDLDTLRNRQKNRQILSPFRSGCDMFSLCLAPNMCWSSRSPQPYFVQRTVL